MSTRWTKIMGYLNAFFFGYMMVDFFITHSILSLLIGGLNLTAAVLAFRRVSEYEKIER